MVEEEEEEEGVVNESTEHMKYPGYCHTSGALKLLRQSVGPELIRVDSR